MCWTNKTGHDTDQASVVQRPLVFGTCLRCSVQLRLATHMWLNSFHVDWEILGRQFSYQRRKEDIATVQAKLIQEGKEQLLGYEAVHWLRAKAIARMIIWLANV